MGGKRVSIIISKKGEDGGLTIERMDASQFEGIEGEGWAEVDTVAEGDLSREQVAEAERGVATRLLEMYSKK